MIRSIIETHPTSTPFLVGMIHLQALPGAPETPHSLDEVVEQAVGDAEALAQAGFDAIMLENYHDTPFHKLRVPTITVSAMTRCALAVRQAAPKQYLGINVLRNDGISALDVATVVGAQFIRVNVLTGAMVTDQGIIEGCASELIRHRSNLDSQVEIWADIAVKHAAPLGHFSLEQLAQDTAWRGHAHALIVSGRATGMPTETKDIEAARNAVGSTPIVVGSGATLSNVRHLGADAIIVGTSIKTEGRVDRDKALAFVEHARGV